MVLSCPREAEKHTTRENEYERALREDEWRAGEGGCVGVGVHKGRGETAGLGGSFNVCMTRRRRVSCCRGGSVIKKKKQHRAPIYHKKHRDRKSWSKSRKGAFGAVTGRDIGDTISLNAEKWGRAKVSRARKRRDNTKRTG